MDIKTRRHIAQAARAVSAASATDSMEGRILQAIVLFLRDLKKEIEGTAAQRVYPLKWSQTASEPKSLMGTAQGVEVEVEMSFDVKARPVLTVTVNGKRTEDDLISGPQKLMTPQRAALFVSQALGEFYRAGLPTRWEASDY